jgi:poly-beta-hydroxyalkanoate depolymerase
MTSPLYPLTSSIHSGNSRAIQSQFEMTASSTTPYANPEYAIHRWKIPMRSAMVQVVNVNTPAILMPKTFSNS